jgi:hypothetical protein
MSRVSAALWRNLIALQIYGANTGVGKTVFSTLLGAHFIRREDKKRWALSYIKPVSTGPSSEADDRYVRRHTGKSTHTIFQFSDPVSPHVAARGSQHSVSGTSIIFVIGCFNTVKLLQSLTHKNMLKTKRRHVVHSQAATRPRCSLRASYWRLLPHSHLSKSCKARDTLFCGYSQGQRMLRTVRPWYHGKDFGHGIEVQGDRIRVIAWLDAIVQALTSITFESRVNRRISIYA